MDAKEVIWNKRGVDPVLMLPEPSLRDIIESILRPDLPQYPSVIREKALSRVLLELMDAHEELQKAMARFEV